jgi:hypothetical protein
MKEFLKSVIFLCVVVCGVIWFVWTIAPAQAAGGIFMFDVVMGSNRHCYYDHGGGDIRVKVIHSSSPCPMSN